MRGVEIDPGVLTELSRLSFLPNGKERMIEYLGKLGVIVLDLSHDHAPDESSEVRFYRKMMEEEDVSLASDPALQRLGRQLVTHGLFIVPFDPYSPMDRPFVEKSIILLAHFADCETLLHETIHCLINEFYLSNGASRIHPRTALVLELQRLLPDSDPNDLEAYRTSLRILNQITLLTLREELAVRFILLELEARAIFLKQIEEQLIRVEEKLKSRWELYRSRFNQEITDVEMGRAIEGFKILKAKVGRELEKSSVRKWLWRKPSQIPEFFIQLCALKVAFMGKLNGASRAP